MTPEKKVKNKVVAILKEHKAYYFYPMTGGYGRSGVPDIVGCYRGIFFGIVCKAKGNQPTALQSKNLSDIMSAGGMAMIVNENNISDVEYMLRSIRDEETAYE